MGKKRFHYRGAELRITAGTKRGQKYTIASVSRDGRTAIIKPLYWWSLSYSQTTAVMVGLMFLIAIFAVLIARDARWFGWGR